jgi:uncharacterized protein (TIGR03437 family)
MLSSARRLLKQPIDALFVAVFAAGCTFAQGPSLSLASGTTVKGGSVALNLSLSPASETPSGLQWTLSYPPADVTAVSLVAGSALTAANKTLTCSAVAGSVTCLAMGADTAAISSGVVAVLTATVSPNASSNQESLPINNVMGTRTDGTLLVISGMGGVISVAPSALPTVSSLQCSPATLASGSTSTCTVMLSGPAPSSGSVISLTKTNAALTVPPSITVAGGATSATFSATTGTLVSNQSAILTAAFNGSTANATLNLTVGPVLVSALTCSPSILASHSSSSCTVTLSKAAPAGGATVTLSDNSSMLTVPSSVTVPEAATSAIFKATTGTIGSNSSATITASYNSSSATASITITAASEATTYSVWSSTTAPATVTDPDTQRVELGMKFRSSVPGSITGVRFYKGPQNTGTHVGHLWSKTGTLLATVTFTGETASGWQQATFATPVAITSNTTYVVSYLAPAGHYSANVNYFSNSAVNGPLTALRNGQDGSNGVYAYGTSSTFPTSTWSSANYWVDVVFKPVTGTLTSNATSMSALSATPTKANSTSLSCAPKVVHPGQSFVCELQQAGASGLAELSVGEAIGVQLPAIATGSKKRSSAVFRGSVNGGTAQQSVTVAATSGIRRAEDTITVLPDVTPAISAPPAQLIKYGTPVAFKITVNSPDPMVLTAGDVPAGALFDASTGQFEWTPAANQQGVYDVYFTAKTVVGTATKSVRIAVDAGIPMVAENAGLVCSAGALATVTGKWLGPTDPLADARGQSANLGGTVVRVNESVVPVLYAAQTQVSFLCPAGQPGDELRVVVETPSGSTELNTTLQYANPVILSREGSEQGLIYDSATAELAMVQDVSSYGRPAQPGDALTIRATGLGKGIPVFVTMGGSYVEVLSVSPSVDAAGVWEIQVTVPTNSELGDDVPVQLEIALPDGRLLKSKTVTIAVKAAL